MSKERSAISGQRAALLALLLFTVHCPLSTLSASDTIPCLIGSNDYYVTAAPWDELVAAVQERTWNALYQTGYVDKIGYWHKDLADIRSDRNTGIYVERLDYELWQLASEGTYLAITTATYNVATVSNLPSAWTAHDLGLWISNTFVNCDGTRGVGLVTSNDWFWSVDFSVQDLFLGEARYEITGSGWTTNWPGSTGTQVRVYTCEWVYADGPMVVDRASSFPPYWSDIWIGDDDAYSPYHTVYASFDRMVPQATNLIIEIDLGSTNWSALASNVAVWIVGATNYVNVGAGIIDPVLHSNSVAVAGGDGDRTNVSFLAYDLGEQNWNYWGGWIFGDHEVASGIWCTNVALWTNASPVHLGDTLRVLLPKGRLYAKPGRSDMGTSSGWLSREWINERYAVACALRYMVYAPSTPHSEQFGYTNSWGAGGWVATTTNNGAVYARRLPWYSVTKRSFADLAVVIGTNQDLDAGAAVYAYCKPYAAWEAFGDGFTVSNCWELMDEQTLETSTSNYVGRYGSSGAIAVGAAAGYSANFRVVAGWNFRHATNGPCW